MENQSVHLIFFMQHFTLEGCGWFSVADDTSRIRRLSLRPDSRYDTHCNCLCRKRDSTFFAVQTCPHSSSLPVLQRILWPVWFCDLNWNSTLPPWLLFTTATSALIAVKLTLLYKDMVTHFDSRVSIKWRPVSISLQSPDNSPVEVWATNHPFSPLLDPVVTQNSIGDRFRRNISV